MDKCETEPDLAYKINAVGARNLAIAASDAGAKLVHISTDYVFPGDVSAHPLTEFDRVKPKSMYGATKLAGENFVRDFADRYFMIRTAWLYGDGHNFAKTMLKLSETNDTIGVVMDQVGNAHQRRGAGQGRQISASHGQLRPVPRHLRGRHELGGVRRRGPEACGKEDGDRAHHLPGVQAPLPGLRGPAGLLDSGELHAEADHRLFLRALAGRHRGLYEGAAGAVRRRTKAYRLYERRDA